MQFLILFLSALVLNCSGGTIVGNGVITYHSERYNFEFSYHKSLKLMERSAEDLELTTQQSGSTKDRPSEKLSFFVVPMQTADIAPVLAYAKKTVPDVSWRDADMGGAPGFKAERAGENKWTQYVLRLSSEAIIVITLVEANRTDIAEALRFALASFTYDLSSPRILSIQFPSSHVKAGNMVRVIVNTEDDQSGIDETTFGIKSPYRHDSTHNEMCIELINPSGHLTPAFCSAPLRTSTGQIVFDFKTQSNLKSDVYWIARFGLSDKDGNNTLATFDLKNRIYRVIRGYTGRDHADCELVRLQESLLHDTTCYELMSAPALTIENDQSVDEDPPHVSDFVIEPSEVKAGQSVTVYFHAEDNLSGLEWRNFFPGQIWFRSIDGTQSSRFLRAIGLPQNLGNDRYQVTINVPKHIPGGQYQLFEQNFSDRAGNTVLLNDNRARLTILKDVIEDNIPPYITETRVEPSQVKAGDMAKILLKASDNLSEVMAVDSCGGENFFPEQAYLYGAYRLTPISICNAELRPIGDGWYEIPVRIAGNTRPGRYRLLQLRIQDQAGNERYLVSRPDDILPYFYDESHAGELMQMPNIFLNVVN